MYYIYVYIYAPFVWVNETIVSVFIQKMFQIKFTVFMFKSHEAN